MKTRHLPHAALAALCLALVVPALHAGTPLICHPYAIDPQWKTLPGGTMKGASRDYDRRNLSRDTLALLQPATPILVRMETLRRAAIYATSGLRQFDNEKYTADDLAVARDLFDRLQQRVKEAEGDARALALFDAGFFAETVRHAHLDLGVDGYPLLLEARQLRPEAAEIDFALALASSWPRGRDSRSEHLAAARAGARPGTLLAANLDSHFGR
ncbi:MAG TPA: hypothetical protein VEB66_03125 [Opitutaceae bacterium]|nr:hypothetical protein [Opitutaceae bacterium]